MTHRQISLQILNPLLTRYVNLINSYNLSLSLFPHLQNEIKKRTTLTGYDN